MFHRKSKCKKLRKIINENSIPYTKKKKTYSSRSDGVRSYGEDGQRHFVGNEKSFRIYDDNVDARQRYCATITTTTAAITNTYTNTNTITITTTTTTTAENDNRSDELREPQERRT